MSRNPIAPVPCPGHGNPVNGGADAVGFPTGGIEGGSVSMLSVLFG